MPWPWRIFLCHHQTEKNLTLLLRPYAQIVFKCMYAKMRKSAQFETFASLCHHNWLMKQIFQLFKICRKSMKALNDLKFPSELCFCIMNVKKDSYLLNSKVSKMQQESALFFYSEMFINFIIYISYQKLYFWIKLTPQESILCIHERCRFKLQCWVDLYWQRWQTKGFSPVWIRRCFAKWLRLEKVLEQ